MIGKTISHYRITARLGEGGMGVVYRAEDTRLGRAVALKFLPPDLTRDTAAKARFIQEARAASALDHPNICTVHEVDETPDGRLFMAMACYEGETLRDRIARGPLPLDEAADVALQIALGLAKAHERGMVHRDIKPANVFVTTDGLVKVLDFGLAKLVGQTGLTRAGTTLGTVSYMSPEQVRGAEADHRSDIWSLGAVLYEMVAGRLPFPSEMAAAFHAIQEVEPAPLSEYRADVSPEMARIVGKCLAKDPDERYPSALDLQVDLRRLGREISATVIAPRSAAVGASAARSALRTRWRRLALGGLAAVVVLSVFVLWQRRGPPATGEPGKRRMLAVLPFENLGPPADEYFAAGVTEEITSRLASVGQIGVISRKSAVLCADTDKTMQQIGRELGVDFVLEGTIRWDRGAGERDRVRITPQLIRVADDTHVWADTYDRVLADIFAVQSEIAHSVVRQLGATLLGREQENVDVRPTQDIAAYHAYLRGRYYAEQPHFSVETTQRAMDCFTEAVRVDPAFALAHAELSILHAKFFYYRHDLSPRRRELARRAINRALALAPHSPRVHLALGYIHLFVELAGRQALDEFALAAEGLPGSAEVLMARGEALRTQGRWDAALESYRQANELDPLSAAPVVEMALTCWWMRRYPEALEHADRAIDLVPDQIWPHLSRIFTFLSWRGSMVEGQSSLEALPRNDPWFHWTRYWHEMLEQRYREALNDLTAVDGDWIRIKICARPTCLLAAYAHDALGEPDLARAAYDSARVLLEHEVERCPQDPRYHGSLGIALAALGRREEALAAGRRAVSLLPIAKDAVYGQPYAVDLVHIYALLGEKEAALEQLDALLDMPSWISAAWVAVDPRWRPLRDHPGFAALIAEHAERGD